MFITPCRPAALMALFKYRYAAYFDTAYLKNSSDQ